MLVVIDYDMGNLKSMSNALKALGLPHEVSGDPAVVERAAAIILPGVGAFGDGMRALERRGLTRVLARRVLEERVPYLGVCLGMQFLADRSCEHGEHAGFGWIPGSVVRIEPGEPGLKVPHMGWNELEVSAPGSPLMREIGDGTAVYFLHGYHFVPDAHARSCIVAATRHGIPLAAAVQHEHVFGVQFHPEKSQGAGLAILKNFADYVQGHAKEASDSIAARP
jgi:imidazole glycerol-phosphate synthase subunit HisH